MALGKQRGRMFDRIIVEARPSFKNSRNAISHTGWQCTGVAEPKAVAESFEEAEEEGMPLFSEVGTSFSIIAPECDPLQIKFQNIITVVDSGTFVRDFQVFPPSHPSHDW